MSKLPIKYSSVNVIPSPAFRKFITSRFSRDSRLPITIQNICKNNLSKCSKIEAEAPEKAVEFTEEEYEFMKAQNEENNLMNCDLDDVNSVEADAKSDDILKSSSQNTSASTLTLSLNDLKWLHQALNRLRKGDPDVPYLHELMEDCEMVLPKNEIQERNPELEARCQKLRKQQEAKEYQAMTRNVDNVRTLMPQDTIAYQMKQINRQLIAVAQFIFSVAAGFAFGFIGIELIIGQLDFGFRLLLGIMIALIIALAEIYFLAKKLNEEYEQQTIQPEATETGKRKVVESIEITSKTSPKAKGKLHQD
ncbi:transmembrane protein 199-like [Ochlerotatus camptorhynchus]|uniref:transmembrane protein 199-like n=1 Tax=Ochlerotatus camptorhynchus TaxID=644619 RepID=UPI0031D5CCAE